MKSEAKANEALETTAKGLQYEREQWAKVLAVKPAEVAKVAKPWDKPAKAKGFFSFLFN